MVCNDTFFEEKHETNVLQNKKGMILFITVIRHKIEVTFPVQKTFYTGSIGNTVE